MKRADRQQLDLLQTEMASDRVDPDYLHTVLTSVFLPLSDPGELRAWVRRDGRRSLVVEAGILPDSTKPEGYDEPGLPYGPKARLVLIYLTAEAIRTKSPEIDVGPSMRSFLAALGISDGGREYAAVREQLRRLRAASIHLSMEGAIAKDRVTRIVEGADFWHGEGRTRWEDKVYLGQRFFAALANHAVPLNPEHVRKLAGSALSLDVYSWLAGRLHRVNGIEFVPWNRLWDQFASGWKDTPSMRRAFRHKFPKTLHEVGRVYEAANCHIEVLDNGLKLTQAPPPIPKLS